MAAAVVFAFREGGRVDGTARVKGTELAPEATGLVTWKGLLARLEATGLPPLAPNKVYHLWLFRPDKAAPDPGATFARVDAGTIAGASRFGAPLPPGSKFAVSLEDGPVPAPRGPIYLLPAP